jgi:signal transduction histidine kinase
MPLEALHRLFRHRQAAWWTLLAGLTLTATVGWEMHREAVEMDRQRLNLRVAQVISQLDSRLEKSEMLLLQLQDYLMLSGENRERVFKTWCYSHGFSINTPWLHGIAVATNRNHVDWEKNFRPRSEPWQEEDWTEVPEFIEKHIVDCDIALTSQVGQFKSFLPNYDLKPLFSGRDPLALIIKGKRMGMSDQCAVMLDRNRQVIMGTLYYTPVYNPQLMDFLGGITKTNGIARRAENSARWAHLDSIILAPVDFNVLAASLWGNSSSDLGIEIFSSTNQSARTWLNPTNGLPRADTAGFTAYLTHRQLWPMYGNKFSIFFYTTPLFEAQSPRRLAYIAMAAGTLLTLLATGFVAWALLARRQQEQMTEQIRDARDALAAAHRERQQFSRDLHDGTIQSLYAIQLGLGHTVQRIDTQPASARQEMAAVRRELDVVIAEIRRFITAESGPNKPVDFNAVLHALVQRAKAGTSAHIDLFCEPRASQCLTADQAVQLANIAREALSNSLRHARPQHVDLSLSSDADTVVLHVRDDGVGFDSKAAGRTGSGLTNMSERAREIAATLELNSAPGKGTRVTVRVPASPLPSSPPGWSDESNLES